MKASRAAYLFTIVGILTVSSAAQSQPALEAREIAAIGRNAIVTVGALHGGELVGYGSGFIIRQDGVIVTNLHVVEDAETLRIRLASGEVYDDVYVLAQDERRDIVVLQVPAVGLPSLEIGDDGEIQVGDRVYVLGNPLGFEGTFSDGILSGKRVQDGIVQLQMTAPISQGSSGGPVLDEGGRVIGIATLIYSEGQNLNVAVPARYAAGLLALSGPAVPFNAGIITSGPDLMDDGGSATDRIDTNEVLALLPADVQADFASLEPSQRQVGLRLLALLTFYNQEGWKEEDDATWGALETGGIDVVEMRLRRGTYQVAAVCDDDCNDLDLAVLDENEEEVVSNFSEDALPIVRFSVDKRRTFYIGVSMASCSVRPCSYAVQVVRKR